MTYLHSQVLSLSSLASAIRCSNSTMPHECDIAHPGLPHSDPHQSAAASISNPAIAVGR
jgi:hypothetical protein